MAPTTRRLIIAILAWPLGIIAGFAWMLFSGPTASCEGQNPCRVEVALEPMSANKLIETAAILFGPGIFATVYWWRGRRESEPPEYPRD